MNFLARRRARQTAPSGSTYAYELAALHLQLMVGMAAADEELRSVEVETLASFIDRSTLRDAELERLEELLRMLVAAPPPLEQLLEQLMQSRHRPKVAAQLVADLASVAHADDFVDPREETLLRLVCGALGVAPATLYQGTARAASDAETEQLRALVHSLVSGN
ncbi:MAG: Tellurite resistance protein TerB [Thermoleophilia bacterium]|nr:Tellurite resistance protein TerB [Thermoleophilia bacterium]